MTAALAVLLGGAGIVAAGFGLYLLTLSLASLIKLPRKPEGRLPPASRLLVLIPAHDEELLIERCVRSLQSQTYPRDLYRLVVIADNCRDRTAEIASAAGAEVMVRTDVDRAGKGRALRWALDGLMRGAGGFDAAVVVDADSIADPRMLEELEREHSAGHQVVQADYEILTEPSSPRAELAAAGFLLFHRVRFGGRARLGMAAALVGNGMLFGRGVLEAHPWDAFSPAEDLELTIDLRLAGVRPRFASHAYVWGPAPVSSQGAMRQRVRWEGGRMHVVRTRLITLIRAAIARRDPTLLDAALDLATPPLGLLALVSCAGALATAALSTARGVPALAFAPWAVAMVALVAFVAVGLFSAGAPAGAWRALARAPLYVAWKVFAYARIARKFDVARWDRTDRVRSRDASRVDVAGVPIDVVDFPGAVERITTAIGGRRLFHVSTVNLDFLVRAQRDLEVRRIFGRADLNVADGTPVVWLARLLGARVSGRVAGADLVPAVLAAAADTGARVFLLGGEDGVAEAAARVLEARLPGLNVAGTYEPPRAEVASTDHSRMLEVIREARPDILLVALGHPKQEMWIDRHREELGVSVAIGVGCVLDLIAGKRRRAPGWMQVAGLEWAFRLGQEPGRLARRYLTDAAWLIPITARALRARRAAAVVEAA